MRRSELFLSQVGSSLEGYCQSVHELLHKIYIARSYSFIFICLPLSTLNQVYNLLSGLGISNIGMRCPRDEKLDFRFYSHVYVVCSCITNFFQLFWLLLLDLLIILEYLKGMYMMYVYVIC